MTGRPYDHTRMRARVISIATFAVADLSRMNYYLASRVPSGVVFALRTSAFARSTRLLSSSSSEDRCCPLPFETLPYRGAEVRLQPRQGSHDDDQFLNKLQSALDYWAENDYTSAWLHIPSSRSGLVETLTSVTIDETGSSSISPSKGLPFDLHHVNATESTIVLKKWLRPNSEDKVPPFATHQVGCAGFVLSDDNEILLVREWSGPPSSRTPTKQWKLPGGLLDAGESFEEAACREVIEETGVQSEFESVLAFWHRHGLVFGKSDFYFVCLLKPTSKEIDIDPVEVSAAKWMPLEQFLTTEDHPLIHHVLEKAYELGKDNEGSFDVALEKLRNCNGRIQPVVEIIEGEVQFGNRSPILTYTGSVAADS